MTMACDQPDNEDVALMSLSFVIPCTPTAQERVRHTVRGGHSVAYKSSTQKAHESELDALLSEHTPVKPLEGPLELFFVVPLPVTRGTSKKRTEGMLCGKIAHTKKPDLDNFAKQIKDAMTRTKFWLDDRQVVRLSCEKRYAKTGSWTICVREKKQ